MSTELRETIVLSYESILSSNYISLLFHHRISQCVMLRQLNLLG